MSLTTGFNLLVMGGTALYSPSFPRGGEAALFSVEVLALLGSPSIAIDVQHKNYDDIAWTSAGSFSAITTIAVHPKDLSGLKEEIRFKYTLSGTDGHGCNMLVAEPAWRPY
jgi:hypothetical protein